ncbi:MAG: exodeoxyribonuclease V subunit gamma [Magnetococcales bacterium]|nr:exodeoxyribonuclease V subunit gamma [Magnetococcales bacterium]
MFSASLPVGLTLVHGNHPEAMRDFLVEWMRRYPLAPLENEVILVQSNGMAQWLKLALAADVSDEPGKGGCGIAAAVEFLLPSRFLWRIYRAVLNPLVVPENSPFDKARLVWRLMRLLPEVMHEPSYAPLLGFLQEDRDRRKCFQLAERLADIFDQYQVYRSDWLDAWARGEDRVINARGKSIPLTAEQKWQALLWRNLLEDVNKGVENERSFAGRADVHAAFLRGVEGWQEGMRPKGVPRRVMVFGISSLPRQSMEVLIAMARWSQVLMCVHNPCEQYWADIVADKDLLRITHGQSSRANIPDDELHLHAHPLLAAWGKQGRDFIGLLDEYNDTMDGSKRVNLFLPHGELTLLNQLQEDIRDLRPLPETRDHWPLVDPSTDHSIRFYIAHSPQREVEILHDQLLAAFNSDDTLRPRDVIVMVPDIDVYTPHIQAVFGLLESHESRYIPFCIADQARRRHDPLLHAVEKLLDLPNSRIATSDLFDLLSVSALRHRFGIDEDDLPLLQHWIQASNIRWGLNATHRKSFGLPLGLEENSWLFGLRRMLLGYAVGSATDVWQGIDPFDEIGGMSAALLGPLVQLLERLESTWLDLSKPATVADWCLRLRTMMADFFSAVDQEDAFTLQQLDQALLQWQEVCDEARLEGELPLAVVGAHWLSQVDGGGLSQRFYAGAVTFATLMPMRAIPFRQVCLLGMNDGDYPRSRPPMDFDLMGWDYRPGDRSRREDDRYLFLEALLSARERLTISWVGRSIHDNTLRPPSVLVGQLRDHLSGGWRLAQENKAGSTLLEALTVEHRLQPFSLDYFSVTTSLFTYANEWRVAGEVGHASIAPLALLPRTEPLTLGELARFLLDPVKVFFNSRLRVSFEPGDLSCQDSEVFDLDPLQTWELRDELIRAQAVVDDSLREQTLANRMERVQRRGDLAVNAFATVMAQELTEPMDDLFLRYQQAIALWPRQTGEDEEIRFRSHTSGVEVVDWLRGIRLNDKGERGYVILEVSNLIKNPGKDKKYQGEKLIRHWVTHLAAHLAGGPLTTMVISPVGSVTLIPLTLAEAHQHMEKIVAAWSEGQCRPLPLAKRTAFAWMDKVEASANLESIDAKALATIRLTYEGDDYNTRGEVGNNLYLQRTYPDFAALLKDGTFVELVETLLRPLHQAIPVVPQKQSEQSWNAGEGA